MAHALAAVVARSTRARISNVEAAVKRRFGVDMTGRLERLDEPIRRSAAIYDAARARMRLSPGYRSLLEVATMRDVDLRQDVDDFEALYKQVTLTLTLTLTLALTLTLTLTPGAPRSSSRR